MTNQIIRLFIEPNLAYSYWKKGKKRLKALIEEYSKRNGLNYLNEGNFSNLRL
jgi:hypothetical protein